MKRAYKTELDLNDKQRACFRRYAGAARFVYNWALADRIARYEAGNPTGLYEQKRRFNAIKHGEFPWLAEIPYQIQEYAFRHLDAAYQHFFRHIKNGEESGFPKFKSKHRSVPSFTVRGCIHIERNRIKLPCVGWIRLKEKSYIPIKDIKIFFVTVSERAGRWYASVQVEEPDMESLNGHGTIGVDAGIKSLALSSDGTASENPKALYKYERKLARLQRELERRKRGGSNWRKTKARIARVHQKIANVRKHAQHQASHHIVEHLQPAVIILEDLNIKGMLKNHRLAKAIMDAGMSELHRQITYKADWRGVQVIKADRWYASSKTCSGCGCIRETLLLSERTFRCPECGLVIDRDLNAAKNLAALDIEGSNGAGLPVELRCSNASL